MEHDNAMPPHRCGSTMAGLSGFAVVFSSLLLLILYFGLRSGNWPHENGVRWIPGQDALSFQPPAIAYVENLLWEPRSGERQEFTIHAAVSPSSLKKKGFRPFLMIHDGQDANQLTVWHWGRSVIAMNGDDYDFSRRRPRIQANGALQIGKVTFISLVSGRDGTCLYIDGVPVTKKPELHLSVPSGKDGARLVLGNSVHGTHGLYGEFHRLSIWPSAQPGTEVKARFLAWQEGGHRIGSGVDGADLVYTFANRSGTEVADYSGNGNTLVIPTRPVVLQKTFLSTPGHGVYSYSFWLDVVLNIVGFIPFGGILLWGLCRLTPLRPVTCLFLAIGACFSLSLCIELLQAWIPGRDSSMQDLLLNSAGGAVGGLLLLVAVRFGLVRLPS